MKNTIRSGNSIPSNNLFLFFFFMIPSRSSFLVDVVRGSGRIRRRHAGNSVANGQGRGRISNVDGILGTRHSKNHDVEVLRNLFDSYGEHFLHIQTNMVPFKKPSNCLRAEFHNSGTTLPKSCIFGHRSSEQEERNISDSIDNRRDVSVAIFIF